MANLAEKHARRKAADHALAWDRETERKTRVLPITAPVMASAGGKGDGGPVYTDRFSQTILDVQRAARDLSTAYRTPLKPIPKGFAMIVRKRD